MAKISAPLWVDAVSGSRYKLGAGIVYTIPRRVTNLLASSNTLSREHLTHYSLLTLELDPLPTAMLASHYLQLNLLISFQYIR